MRGSRLSGYVPRDVKSIYLVGPISLGGRAGKEQTEANLARFHEAASELRRRGYTVENPAENPETDPPRTWSGWMRAGIAQLIRCEAILLLPGWDKSDGAWIEACLAADLGMPVQEYGNFLEGISDGAAYARAIREQARAVKEVS